MKMAGRENRWKDDQLMDSRTVTDRQIDRQTARGGVHEIKKVWHVRCKGDREENEGKGELQQLYTESTKELSVLLHCVILLYICCMHKLLSTEELSVLLRLCQLSWLCCCQLSEP